MLTTYIFFIDHLHHAMATEEAAPLTQDIQSESSTSEAVVKKKRTRLWTPPPQDWVVVVYKNTPKNVIEEIKEQLEEDEVQDMHPGAKMKVIENKRVRFYPSDKKIRRRINAWRRTYAQTEEYKLKHNTPEAKEKARLYNQRPEVQEAKQVRQAAKNLLLKQEKERDPVGFKRKFEQKLQEAAANKKQKVKRNGVTTTVQPISENMAKNPKESAPTNSTTTTKAPEPSVDNRINAALEKGRNTRTK